MGGPPPPLDLSSYAAVARRELLRLLENIPGKKTFVIQQSFAGVVDLLVKFSTLKEYGVDEVFFLERGNVVAHNRNVVFLVRGEEGKNVAAVAEQIKHLKDLSSTHHDFSVFWVPRKTLISSSIFEELGVLGEVSTFELPLYFVPLDRDLISLELTDSYTDLYMRRDPNSIFLAAKALMNLQKQHGLFPRIIGRGDNAKRLADLLVRMRAELSADDKPVNGARSVLGLTPSTTIQNLIIIDREADPVTPLLTQLTYHGLLDEVFRINQNKCEIDSSVAGSTPQPSKDSNLGAQSQRALKRTIQLDSTTDPLFGQLHDTNFAVVGPRIQQIAKRIQSEDKSKNVQQASTAELRDIMQWLPGHQAESAALNLHVHLAEHLQQQTSKSDQFSRVLSVQQNIAAGADPSTQYEAIDELIARGAHINTVLRLLCIASIFSSGLKTKDLEHFSQLILHAYGHQHLLTLASLSKAGLLTSKTTSSALSSIPGAAVVTAASSITTTTSTSTSHTTSPATNYSTLRRTLRLWTDEIDESQPDDIAYAYSGYAPLSVRLVQCVVAKPLLAATIRAPATLQAAATTSAAQGFKPFDDALRAVHGPTVDLAQEPDPADRPAVSSRKVLSGGQRAERISVVMFVGGVCWAEVAALRWLEQRLREKEGETRRLVVATTGIISGDRIVEGALQRQGLANTVAASTESSTAGLAASGSSGATANGT